MKSKRKTSITARIIIFFNFLAVISLVMVYAGTRIPPDAIWPLAFAGLAYPLILIVNILFVLFWILKRRLWFLLSLVTILAGYEQLGAFFRYSDINKPLPQQGQNIQVLSYNVRVFDLYNYGSKWELNFTRRNQIFNFLREQNPDIICFQEFVHDKSGAFKTIDTIPSFLRARYSHAGYSQSSKNINFFGLATFSAYPIIKKGKIEFPTQMGNMCIFTDIRIGRDTIRIYNAHFESIGLSQEDYVFVENVAGTSNISDRNYLQRSSVRILRRLKKAYQQRVVQVDMVAQHIEQSPYPAILAGDFNDTPSSWAYRRLTRTLDDAFSSGRGVGQTYSGKIPGIRIDYILHSKDFTPYNFNTGTKVYSDHFPVWVWLNLDNDKQ